MDPNTLEAMMRQMAFGVEPFNPSQDTPQDVGLGGPSTEYLVTGEIPGMGWVNYPTIWWGESGVPFLLDDDAAVNMSLDYMDATGTKLPQYENAGQAVERAVHRSAMGGATKNPLFLGDW